MEKNSCINYILIFRCYYFLNGHKTEKDKKRKTGKPENRKKQKTKKMY